MSSAPSSSSPPPPPTQEQDIYHPDFKLYEDADLVVRSCDGKLFATRALYLRAASPIFDGMMKIGSPELGEKRDGLPLLQISEDAVQTRVLLRLLQRDKFEIAHDTLLTFDKLFTLSPLVEKYVVSPSLVTFLYGYVLSNFLPDRNNGSRPQQAVHAMDVVALGLIHHQERMVRRGLRVLHTWGLKEEEHGSTSPKWDANDTKKITVRVRDFSLDSVSPELIPRISVKHLQQLALMHAKVTSRDGYTWLKAADDFKASLRFFRRVVCFVPQLTSSFSLSQM